MRATAPSASDAGAKGVDGKDKPKGVSLQTTKDGRVYVHLSFAATLSRWKVAFLVASALLAAALASAPSFLSESSALKRRVRELEGRLSRKLGWYLRHREHLREHIKSDWVPPAHADGRAHLLSDPEGVSKLAEALVPETGLAVFDDHYLCGEHDATETEVIKKKIAIAAVTWNAPLSLRNSMESWRAGGLLDIVDERMLFINRSPSAAEDAAIAAEFGFDVYTTEEHNGNIMAGPSIAYLVGNSSADYVLFMEKDFVLTAPRDVMMREMYIGVQHLARGVDVYRLRGASDYPAEGMPDCCAPANPPTCPYHSNWKSAGYFSDHMNWLLIFCDPKIMEHSNGRLVRCTLESQGAVDSYCYTSGETNWSNNPVLMSREWFNRKVREVAFKDWDRNNMFEFNLMIDWLTWRPPAKVCMSWQGIFAHNEIDQ